MENLRFPVEISTEEMRNRDFSWSARMYRRVVIPTRAVRRVGDLLNDYQNGIEVGSLAYVPRSPFNFIRTKALQENTFLTQFKGESVIPITPKAYRKATENYPGREINDGDILYARGGSVGEVAIADGCGQATISGHLLSLKFADDPLYCLAFMKHQVCKLQQQPNVKGAIRALDNFNINTLLDCLIPFPNQVNADEVIRYVSAITQAIVEKERAIRNRSERITELIQAELESGQTSTPFVFEHPTISELRALNRLDAAIYDLEYKSKIWLIQNYAGGSVTPTQDGFIVTPGPSLEIKLLRTRLDSDTFKPGFYALILPTNISVYGTMNSVPYMGTAKKLPLLKQGDIIFGEAGFQKGRSIVLLDNIERCTTNAHGLYARRTDGDIHKSIFFRCIFNWYRSMRLIDLMAVGGSGGHFSPEYFDYLRIPRFSEDKQLEITRLYHNAVLPPADAPTLDTFADWHRRWNAQLGVWELDREMKSLQRTLAEVQEQIIEGITVSIPYQHSSRPKFEHVMDKVPDVEPEEADRI